MVRIVILQHNNHLVAWVVYCDTATLPLLFSPLFSSSLLSHQVKLSVVVAYFKACTYSLSLLTIFLSVCQNGASIASNFWLADWSNAEDAILGLNTSAPNFTYNHTTACDGQFGPSL